MNAEQLGRVLRATEGNNGSRRLAAQFLVDMPPPVRAIRAEELIGGCAGMRPQQTQRYLEAAAIRPETPLGDLSLPQRAALAGALRLRRG
jgi:hypothetical protein